YVTRLKRKDSYVGALVRKRPLCSKELASISQFRSCGAIPSNLPNSIDDHPRYQCRLGTDGQRTSSDGDRLAGPAAMGITLDDGHHYPRNPVGSGDHAERAPTDEPRSCIHAAD